MDMPTFDELRDLAQRDPEGFEILRAELIEDCIRRSSGCNQRRLRGLQFVIETRRRVAGSPTKALLDIQAMMYDSLLGLQQALLVQQRPSEPSAPTSARVLQFRRSLTSSNGSTSTTQTVAPVLAPDDFWHQEPGYERDDMQ